MAITREPIPYADRCAAGRTLASALATYRDTPGLLVLALPRGGVPAADIDTVLQRERAELMRREQAYRGNRPPLQLAGRTVLLVDDGLATGATMEVAVQVLRAMSPAKLVVAVPVAAPDAAARLRGLADDVICPLLPEHLRAVGLWYRDFSQTTDDEVLTLLGAH